VGGRGGRQQVPVTRQPAAPASTPKGQEAPYRDPGAGALAALGRASGGGSRGRPGQGSERACLLVEPPPSRCPPSRLPLTESTGEQGPLALAYHWVTERVRLATCEQLGAAHPQGPPRQDSSALEGHPVRRRLARVGLPRRLPLRHWPLRHPPRSHRRLTRRGFGLPPTRRSPRRPRRYGLSS